MKMHTGVDAESGLIHSVVCTAANEAGVAHGHELLHGQESAVHGDSGYTGLDKRNEVKAAQDEGRLRPEIGWFIAMKRGQLKSLPDGPAKALYEWFERRKAQIRAIVEHPFHVIKNLFGYRKVSYCGLAKNRVRALAHPALVNLVLAKPRLLLDEQIHSQAAHRATSRRQTAYPVRDWPDRREESRRRSRVAKWSPSLSSRWTGCAVVQRYPYRLARPCHPPVRPTGWLPYRHGAAGAGLLSQGHPAIHLSPLDFNRARPTEPSETNWWAARSDCVDNSTGSVLRRPLLVAAHAKLAWRLRGASAAHKASKVPEPTLPHIPRNRFDERTGAAVVSVTRPARWAIVGGLMLMSGYATPLSHDVPSSPFDVQTYSSSEKALLPEYCRDTQDRAGRSVDGNLRQQRWLALMGETFWHMHHYCYGLVKKMRADAMLPSDVVRSSLLRSAIEEMEYVRVRAPQDFILMPELWLHEGTYYAALAQPAAALECFERSRAAKVDYWPAYVEAAKVNLTIRRRQEAIDILRAGLKIVPDHPSIKAELDQLMADPVRQHATPFRSTP